MTLMALNSSKHLPQFAEVLDRMGQAISKGSGYAREALEITKITQLVDRNKMRRKQTRGRHILETTWLDTVMSMDHPTPL